MSSSPDMYGLEMLLKLENDNVTDKTDMLTLFVHWFLSRNGFRAVGIGDDKSMPNMVEHSELLPEGWNANKASYALRYVMRDELFILYGSVLNGTMIFNLLHVNSLHVTNVAFDVEAAIGTPAAGNPISVGMVNNLNEQIVRLVEDLLIGDGSRGSILPTGSGVGPGPWIDYGGGILRCNLGNSRSAMYLNVPHQHAAAHAAAYRHPVPGPVRFVIPQNVRNAPGAPQANHDA